MGFADRKGPWGSDGRPQSHTDALRAGQQSRRTGVCKEFTADGYDIYQAGAFVFIFAEDGAAARELGNAFKETSTGQCATAVRGRRTNILHLSTTATREALPEPRAALQHPRPNLARLLAGARLATTLRERPRSSYHVRRSGRTDYCHQNAYKWPTCLSSPSRGSYCVSQCRARPCGYGFWLSPFYSSALVVLC